MVQSAISTGGALAGAPSSLIALDADLDPPNVAECRDLLERLRLVSDGRCDVGRVHPMAAVLTLAAAAVVGGMRSYTAIAGWVADTPAELLEQMWARCGRAAAAPSNARSGG